MSLLEELRKKPKQVRYNIALVVALVITGCIAFLWSLSLPAQLESTAREKPEDTAENVANDELDFFDSFGNVKSQFSNVKEAFESIDLESETTESQTEDTEVETMGTEENIGDGFEEMTEGPEGVSDSNSEENDGTSLYRIVPVDEGETAEEPVPEEGEPHMILIGTTTSEKAE